MKKFSYLVASLMLGTAVIAAPAWARNDSNSNSGSTASAQQFQSDDERKAYEEMYGPCFKEKNDDKCYPLAKAFAEKYPNSQFVKYATGKVNAIEAKRLYDNFQNALKKFYEGGPDAAKLDVLLAAGDAYTGKFPEDQFAVTQLALAAGGGVLGGYYKDLSKAQMWTEKALKLLEPTSAPPKWKQEDWDKFRTQGISNITLYEGLFQLRQPTPNVEQALVYLNKVASNKDWPNAKEPAVYLLRAEANNITYDKLSEEYRALSEDDKRGDKGKAILAKIDPVVDALIDDYARALAIAGKDPRLKPIADDVRPRLESFWKFRNNGKLDGMMEYVKHFEADPTVQPPPKTASSTPATAAPSTKPKG